MDELERLKKINNPQRRAESVGGLVSLKNCLEHNGFDLRGDEFVVKRNSDGRPFFLNEKLPDISITHSGEFSAAVVGDGTGRGGIDIEAVSSDENGGHSARYEKIAERYFTNKEKEAFLTACDRRLEFLKIWTSKEAYAKCRGISLAGLIAEGGNRKADHENNYLFCFKLSYNEREYVLSLCSENGGEPVILFPDGCTAEELQ